MPPNAFIFTNIEPGPGRVCSIARLFLFPGHLKLFHPVPLKTKTYINLRVSNLKHLLTRHNSSYLGKVFLIFSWLKTVKEIYHRGLDPTTTMEYKWIFYSAIRDLLARTRHFYKYLYTINKKSLLIPFACYGKLFIFLGFTFLLLLLEWTRVKLFIRRSLWLGQ